MEENKTTKTTQHEHHYYYGCFPGKSWIAFCGVTLVIIGSFWLLEELGIIYWFWWDLVIPIILIVWGSSYILYHFRHYNRN